MKTTYSDPSVNIKVSKSIRDMGPWAIDGTIELLSVKWREGETVRNIRDALLERCGAVVSRSAIIAKAERLGLGRHPNALSVSERLKRRIAKKAKKAKPRKPKQAAKKSPVPIPPEPLPPPRIEDVARVQFVDLTPTMCKWPVGDPGKPGFGFCGCEKPRGSRHPYCATHQARAWHSTRGVA